jgi:adenine C2-methylase RlmN of 23S rRNA A2503 and tRNA A37
MSVKAKKEQRRCHWAQSPLMVEYHDRDWGKPVHDDRVLFEFLILEGAQDRSQQARELSACIRRVRCEENRAVRQA